MIDHLDASPPLIAKPRPVVTTVIGVTPSDGITDPAICAVRYDAQLITPGDPLFGEFPIFETHYTVLGTEESDPSLSLPALAARVNLLARRLYDRNSLGDYHVLVDASHAGRPVVDAIRSSVIPQIQVTAVVVGSSDAGSLSLLWKQETTVGLSYLLSRLQAILQGKRLHGLPERLSALLAEYEIEGTERRPDLVRALALACASEYQAVRYGQSPDTLPSPRL